MLPREVCIRALLVEAILDNKIIARLLRVVIAVCGDRRNCVGDLVTIRHIDEQEALHDTVVHKTLHRMDELDMV